jgi:hypothetical protein
MFGTRQLSLAALWGSVILQVRVFWNGTQHINQLTINDSIGGPRIKPIPPLLPGYTSKKKADGSKNYESLLEVWNQLSNSTNHEMGHMMVPRAFPRTQSILKDQITVAVHASTTKLNRLLFSIKRWGGPTSAAVYIQSENDIHDLIDFYSTHAKSLAYTDIHVVMERTDLPYPHNILRQTALDHVDSDYFLTLDVDFVTPPDASKRLDALLRSDSKLTAQIQNKTLIVLPAFNREKKVNDTEILDIGGSFLPKNKEEVLNLIATDEMTPFHHAVFSQGHGPTNYEEWYFGNPSSDSSSYAIDYAKKYEPYVIGYARQPDVPQYRQSFRGFGYNKWTWIMEAYLTGFQFAVLKDFFVVHIDHPLSAQRQDQRYKNKPEYKRFRGSLKKKLSWGKETFDDLFCSMDYIAEANYEGPDDVPSLVAWKEFKGKCLARCFLDVYRRCLTCS